MAGGKPPAGATCALACLSALLLAAGLAGLAGSLMLDAAGPVGRGAQNQAAYASGLATCTAVLGFVTATAWQHRLFAFFVAQLGAVCLCTWLVASVLHRVDAGAVAELRSSTHWVGDARLLGVAPSDLDECGDAVEGEGQLDEGCWGVLEPRLRVAMRRGVIGGAACLLVPQILTLCAQHPSPSLRAPLVEEWWNGSGWWQSGRSGSQ